MTAGTALVSFCAVIFAVIWAAPAAAEYWTFEERVTDDHIVCDLTFDDGDMTVSIFYETAGQTYALVATLPDGTWPDATPFSIDFRGGRDMSIATDRHVLLDGNRTLTVVDSGFGNVLDGIEFNRNALLTLGETFIAVPLDGATDPIRAFRACPSQQLS